MPQTDVTNLTPAQWRDDVEMLRSEILTHHPNPFHHTTESRFRQRADYLAGEGAETQSHLMLAGLVSLAASVGDGHTFVDAGPHCHTLPLGVFWFGNDLRVRQAAEPYARALGCRVVAVKGTATDEVQRHLQAFIPQAENRWYVLHQSARRWVQVEMLSGGLGLPPAAPVPITFEDGLKRQFTLDIAPLAPGVQMPLLDAAASLPLYRQNADQGFWVTFLPASNTVYVGFRSYQDLEADAAALVRFVDEQPPRKLVIDLRQNGGGNFDLVRRHLIPAIVARPHLNRRGALFVITGRQTFSAAMANAADFRRDTQALLVGEPAGARPNGYQELHSFTLPHSGLRAGCSLCHYRFQDEETDFVPLDARIDPNWVAYKAGRDPVMEWIAQCSLPPDATRDLRPG